MIAQRILSAAGWPHLDHRRPLRFLRSRQPFSIFTKSRVRKGGIVKPRFSAGGRKLIQLDQGINIWKEYNWPNTPVMAMILKPFMNIDPAFFGSQVWLFVKMICAVASIYLVFSMLDQPRHPFPFWGKALTVVLALRPIQGDLFHGNVNLFILLTIVLALFAFSRGWDVTAGLTLRAGHRLQDYAGAVFAVSCVEASMESACRRVRGRRTVALRRAEFLLRLAANWDGVSSWLDGMVLPYIVKNEITSEHQNQSLPGLLERIFRHRVAVVQANHPEEYLNIADVSSRALSLVVKGCMAAFCLAVMWRSTPRNDRTDSALDGRVRHRRARNVDL